MIYPLTSQTVPRNTDEFRRVTFLKRCTVAEDNTVSFTHDGQSFHLSMPVDLVTQEVLIDAAFNVECGGKNYGVATRA